jgi:SAM-dependent methyltransferase
MTKNHTQHWEKVWTGSAHTDKSWFQKTPWISLEMIARSGVSSAEPLIDVGGGASRLVDHLLDRGYRDLTVLDLSDAALEHARRRLGERAGAVRWIEGDVTTFRPDREYALWHDRAAFHFLVSASDRNAYGEVMNRSLKADGQAIIGAFAPDGPAKCSGLDVVRYDAGSLMAELGPGWALAEETAETHVTPAGAGQRFGFYRTRRTAALKNYSG